MSLTQAHACVPWCPHSFACRVSTLTSQEGVDTSCSSSSDKNLNQHESADQDWAQATSVRITLETRTVSLGDRQHSDSTQSLQGIRKGQGSDSLCGEGCKWDWHLMAGSRSRVSPQTTAPTVSCVLAVHHVALVCLMRPTHNILTSWHQQRCSPASPQQFLVSISLWGGHTLQHCHFVASRERRPALIAESSFSCHRCCTHVSHACNAWHVRSFASRSSPASQHCNPLACFMVALVRRENSHVCM